MVALGGGNVRGLPRTPIRGTKGANRQAIDPPLISHPVYPCQPANRSVCPFRWTKGARAQRAGYARRCRIKKTLFGAVAQLGERIVRNDEVGGSNPPSSTTVCGFH